MDEIVREFGTWKNKKDAYTAGKIAVEKEENILAREYHLIRKLLCVDIVLSEILIRL